MTEPLMATEGESFPSLERLHVHYKKRLRKAATKAEEEAIRAEYDTARAQFHAEHDDSPTPLLTAASDAEARAWAHQHYGEPAAAAGGAMHRTPAPPSPIQITLPKVEVTND